MCGELIVASAIKCRFCGETLSSTVRNREQQRDSAATGNQLTGGDVRISVQQQVNVGQDLDRNQLTVADIAICALRFPIGCIVGIVAMITGQPAHGLKMVGLALVMPFLWGAIASIFR